MTSSYNPLNLLKSGSPEQQAIQRDLINVAGTLAPAGDLLEKVFLIDKLEEYGLVPKFNAVESVNQMRDAAAVDNPLVVSTQQLAEQKQEAAEAKQPNEVDIPEREVKPTAPPEPLPTGRDRLDQSQVDLNKAVIDILRQSVDPETRRRNAEIDAEIQRQRDVFLAQERQKGLQELTRRDTIQRWYALRQEQVRSNALMAMSLQNTAYIANTPNANVLSALQQPLQIAAQSVQQGKSVI
jgi:hypothetical protein